MDTVLHTIANRELRFHKTASRRANNDTVITRGVLDYQNELLQSPLGYSNLRNTSLRSL